LKQRYITVIKQPQDQEVEPISSREAAASRLLDAAWDLLTSEGPAALTTRRIAERAGTSTMSIYSRFGGKDGILEELYGQGMLMLEDELSAAPEAPDPRARILELGSAYRRFAVGNPGLYALMFERPLPGFDPSAKARLQALGRTFGILISAVEQASAAGAIQSSDATETSYLFWTSLHGMVSLELTHAVRGDLPGWLIDSSEAAERVYRRGMEVVLSGLR
jgi:AcrR family transcriptional regulator